MVRAWSLLDCNCVRYASGAPFCAHWAPSILSSMGIIFVACDEISWRTAAMSQSVSSPAGCCGARACAESATAQAKMTEARSAGDVMSPNLAWGEDLDAA